MHRISLKKITILLALILLINSIFIPTLFDLNQRAKASSSIGKEDVYAGLGLMFLLVVLSGNNSSSQSEVQHDDFYNYNNFSAEEIETLASIIHAEARGETFQGKVAVGAVILNRVYHPNFPNTIDGVVYQSGQFKPVENGMIDLRPDSDSFQAAYDAVSGIDPSRGSLYFYNPKKSQNPDFFAKRTKVVEIGNHVFLK